MLAPDLESPLVSQTSVGSHFEQPFDVFSQLGFQNIGRHLEVLPLFIVAEPVQEPAGHSLAFGVGDDVCYFIALLLVEFAGPDSRIDPEDFANEEAESAAYSLDFLEGVGRGPLAVDVGVEDTMDVLEVGVWVFDDQ